jgi:hypothetical protein
MPTDVDPGKIQRELLAQLDRTIAEYRLASIACDNSSEDDRPRAVLEKNHTLRNYDAALARYNDFVISGIVPGDLVEKARTAGH